ncbi:MAG: hypothetical protein ACI9SK_000450 [Zhongshania sp.]
MPCRILDIIWLLLKLPESVMRFVVPTGLIFILCVPLAHAGCVLPLPSLSFSDDTTANSETMTLTKRRVEGYLDNSARFIKRLDTTAKVAVVTGRDNEERRRRLGEYC